MGEHADAAPSSAPDRVEPTRSQPAVETAQRTAPSGGLELDAAEDETEREADRIAGLVQRTLATSPPAFAMSTVGSRIHRSGSAGVIRRSRSDGRPNKLPPHFAPANFKANTSVRGARRGESLRTIDKWLQQAAAATTYDDQQYALKQVVDAAEHWLGKHGADSGGGKRSVRRRRGTVQAIRSVSSMAYVGPRDAGGPSGSGRAESPEDTGDSRVEVAAGLLDAIADSAGITGDYADRNLDLDTVHASGDGEGTSMSAESGAGLNSTPFDVLETANVVTGAFAIRGGLGDVGKEGNDSFDDVEAGGRALAGGGQLIHGAYKGWKAVGVMSGGDSTTHTQVGDIGAAYADGLGAIADTLTTIKGFRDANKKGATQGGLTSREKFDRAADVTVGALSATQKTTKTALDITKAATEVGATHTIAGLSTAAGAVGLVVSVIETVRGGIDIYRAWSTTRDLEAAEAAQHELIAVVGERLGTARDATNKFIGDLSHDIFNADEGELDTLFAAWGRLERDYEQLVATQRRYQPAMDGMKKLQARQAESGAFKAAKGTVGIVSGALLLSGVGAPIAVGVAAIAGIIALSEAGLKLARNSAATGLIEIARRLDDDGRPVGKPDNAPTYRTMERRTYAAYDRHLRAVIASKVPFGFEEGEFGAIKQFSWDDKKARLKSEDKEVVEGFAAVDALPDDTKRNKWIEVHVGDQVHKEKPKGTAKVKRSVAPSAHKSSQAMEASKDDIVDALFHLGRGSFDKDTQKFKEVPIDPVGDTDLIENMQLITVHALLDAADITSERWAAWLTTAAGDEANMRDLIRGQLP